MKCCLGVLLISLLAVSVFAQESSKYLQVERLMISGYAFKMLKDSTKIEQIGGDSVSLNKVNQSRDSSTTRQIPPTQSQLEDRQHNNYDFEREAKAPNNQYISLVLENLCDKEIKSVSFQLHLSQNGKKYFERNFRIKRRVMPGDNLYFRERFFSDKDLSKPNIEKEIIIKNIEFADGTKLKF